MRRRAFTPGGARTRSQCCTAASVGQLVESVEETSYSGFRSCSGKVITRPSVFLTVPLALRSR